MKVLLAPMEGVIDAPLRALLTAIGGYDHCVTEFLRITDRLLPAKAFRRLCPELANHCRTPSGTPVMLQLLGGETSVMAENAHKAAELGAYGIDLNFGCPSRFVTRKDGGAILLRTPERVHNIVSAVRRAVPDAVPVSAKIRLGDEDTSLALENARAVESAGADYITVHARTRRDGYRAPARWEWLGCIREALQLPVIANGDICNAEDYQRCLAISGCEDVMVGRGAVSRPDLGRHLRLSHQGLENERMSWAEVTALLLALGEQMAEERHGRHVASRLKQWLNLLRREYPEAAGCFAELRQLQHFAEIRPLLTERSAA
jgi:tRNA-dihydrouridine synthase C